MSRKHISITIVGLAVLMSATGCTPAATSDPQSLSIAYAQEGSTSKADVSVDGLRCSETQGVRSFIGGDDVDGRAAVTVSILDDQATVAIHLEDDRWFVGSGTAQADDDSVTFDGFEGSVVEQGADLDILGVVDDAATLTGVLTCG